MKIIIQNCKCETWNRLLYKHWRVGHKAKQEMQEVVYWTLMEQKAKWEQFIGPVHVKVTAHFKNKAQHDPDNLFVKPILDALVKAEILKDDNGDVVQKLTLATEKGMPMDLIAIEINNYEKE